MNKIIQNYGVSKTIVQRNNQISKHEMEWIGDYDGKNANLHLHMNDNGNWKEIQMKFDNDDLFKLLSMPTVETPLERRLATDFLYTHPHRHSKHKKTRTIVKRKSKKSRKK